MAEVINLNHFRKAQKKAEKDTQSARNRVRHGRRKDDRKRHRKDEDRRQQDLDGQVLAGDRKDDNTGGDEPV